ncbi:hypothetical protein KQX54_011926 [Cotesia glomerata]|uniref:Uncharacterized protein n=1 Tax=Cotesia glomerata TaxID=32391 RepID=A0AAV7IYB9_COTGL|nr:hypothetical protein KQX54_011926 [Cotesia glomerata]
MGNLSFTRAMLDMLLNIVTGSVTLKDIRRHTETAFHLVNAAKREESGNPTEQAWELCSDRENPFTKEVRQVVNQLEDDAVVVQNAKRNFRRRRVQEDFAEIHEHYSCLPVFIKRLECRQISLRHSCMIVRNAVIEIIQNPQAVQSVKDRLQAVLDDNTGFSVHLNNINNCLIQNRFNALPPNWNEDDARNLTSFEFDNFAMHLISNVNVFED